MAIESSDYQRSVLEDASFIRGSIIGSYAQVEFLLADFAVRSSHLPEYASVLKTFPYKLGSRLRAISAMVSLPGPISEYATELLPTVNKILEYEETRHFMAHGLLIVHTHEDVWHQLEYRLYVPKPGGLTIGTLKTDLEGLDVKAREVAAYSQAMVGLFRRIYSEQRLELAAPPKSLMLNGTEPMGLAIARKAGQVVHVSHNRCTTAEQQA